MPSQIKYILGNEAAERYSFYGMRSILVVFMVQHLLMKETDATSIYHIFAGLCYFFPLFGAYISDRYLGKYQTIISLSIIYCLGHLVLSLYESTVGTYVGLLLIAIGSGGIKPCVSAHVGDQFKVGEESKMAKVYDLFYWMINFGSFFSTILTPFTLEKFGPSLAFGVPGVLMLIATFIFWLGRNQYVHVKPTGKNPHSALSILVSGLKKVENKKLNFWQRAELQHPKEAVEGLKAALTVGKIFLFISIFWALFDQHGSTWVLQASHMDLHLLGVDLLPSQIQTANPVMVLLLIPCFTFFIYPMLRKMGVDLTPLKKMSLGIYLAAFSFAIAATLQWIIDDGNKISVVWQLLSYLALTASEVMISITGLEFAYTQAPKSMKSTIMSMWLLSVFVGNFFTAIISKINIFQGASFYLFFSLLTAFVAVIFSLYAKKYVMKNYMEEETKTPTNSVEIEENLSPQLV